MTVTYTQQQRLFKAYDIRGDRKYFTASFIYALSHAFARLYVNQDVSQNVSQDNSYDNHHPQKELLTTDYCAINTVVIGHDVRHHSRAIAERLVQTLIDYNIKVVWLGLVTTPIMAFWSNRYNGHGIIATASHSPSHINGIKWLVAGESPSSADIRAIYADLITPMSISMSMVIKKPAPSSTVRPQLIQNAIAPSLYRLSALYQTLPTDVVADVYYQQVSHAIARINSKKTQRIIASKRPYKRLKIIIDCLNGATGPFAKAFFEQFSYIDGSITVINNAPNPNFPKGNPDPMQVGRLIELQHAVVTQSADIGLSFDGDGDRVMAVDNLGRVMEADHLLYILALIAVKDTTFSTSPSVIFDVKCSHHLPHLIEQLGAIPHMGKTGSSIMRKTLQSGIKGSDGDTNNDTDSKVIFAGELSGHFIFNDGYFMLHDDAMYAGLRLLNWLSQQSSTLSNFIDTLPFLVNTPDVYLSLDSPNNLDQRNTNDKDEHVIKTQKPVASNNSTTLSKLANLCNRLQTCCSPSRNEAVIYSGNETQSAKARRFPKLSPNEQLNLPADTRLTCIDGLRLDFSTGFGVVRPSNTSHSLTVRFAGNTLSDLQAIQARFVDLFETIDHDLAMQIANIRPIGY